jgi:hypothetical protein
MLCCPNFLRQCAIKQVLNLHCFCVMNNGSRLHVGCQVNEKSSLYVEVNPTNWFIWARCKKLSQLRASCKKVVVSVFYATIATKVGVRCNFIYCYPSEVGCVYKVRLLPDRQRTQKKQNKVDHPNCQAEFT